MDGQPAPLDNIGYRVDRRVATISLDRPRYRNAQSRLLLDDLDAAFARAVDDEQVRVIVVRGEGQHFSSGHDLGTPEEMEDRKARPWPGGWVGDQRRSWELNVANTLRWRDLPKPTIAAVQGMCIYGGWMVASAMDLIVAADDARFLPAHFQYFSVPWDLGPRQTKELLWLAEFVGAEKAEAAGFVNHVVPRAELDDFVADLAARIARQDPFVASMTKRSVNEMQDHQGFRTAVTAAHSTYMQIQAAGLVVPEGQDGKIRRLPGVQASLAREEADAASADPDADPAETGAVGTADGETADADVADDGAVDGRDAGAAGGPSALSEGAERFLAARHRLAMLTILRADGSPSTVPVWFEWDGSELSIFSGAQSSKLRRLAGDRRITVTVANDLDEPEFWVAFDGAARIEETGGLALAERLAARYWDLDDPAKRTTLDGWRSGGDAALRRIVLTPDAVRTA